MVATQTNGKPVVNGQLTHASPQLVMARPAQGASPEDGPNIPISAIRNALRRRWKLALPIGLCLAALAGTAAWMMIVPKYTAAAFLRIRSDDRTLIFETADQAGGGHRNFSLYKNTQKQMMVTPFVLNAALRSEGVSSLPEIRAQADPLFWLQEQLQVSFPADGEIMRVSMSTTSPAASVQLVNAVVGAYMDEVVVSERNERLQRLDNLERVHAEAESKVRNKQAELKQLAAALGTSDSDSLTVAQQSALEQFGIMQEKLSSIQFELMKAEGEMDIARQMQQAAKEAAEVAAADAEQALADASQPAGEIDEPPLFVAPSGNVTRLEEEVALLQARVRSLTASVGARHPSVEPLQEQLQIKQELLKQQRAVDAKRIAAIREEHEKKLAQRQAQRQVVSRGSTTSRSGSHVGQFYDMAEIATRIGVLKKQEEIVREKVDALETETRQLGRSSIDVELMRSEIVGLQGVLRRVGEEIERTSIELKTSSRVNLVSKAETAEAPSPKKRFALTAFGGMTGLLAPFALCVVWDVRRKSVDEVDAVTEALALSSLGTVPLVGDPLGRSKRRLNARRQRQRIELNESIDSMAAMLLHRSRLEGHQAFMISSAMPAEGKSTVSCQLAQSLARSGKRVVLVDFDLRRPTIHRYLDLEQSPGVGELLLGESDLNEAIQTSEQANLSYLTAGVQRGHLHELATSGAIENLFEKLQASFDLVIVDSSPVLPVVDSRIVGTFCDGVILTLIRDASRIPAAAKACELLKSYGVRVLGTVVIGGQSSSYPTYYYYGPDSRSQSSTGVSARLTGPPKKG